MEFAAMPYQRAGFEFLPLECVVIEQAFCFRISSQHHLKSAVEPEAFHYIGAYPAAGPVACFQ
jgi:hypothetical protein